MKPPGWNDSLIPVYQAPLGEDEIPLPDSFDGRTHWPECKDVIGRIGDQLYCGSCWAFAVAHAISDRICIASKGKLKPWISAQDIMECTGAPEDEEGSSTIIGRACNGGWDSAAWYHYVHQGFVTGSTEKGKLHGCKPYLFTCGHRSESDYCPYASDMMMGCMKKCEYSEYIIGNFTKPGENAKEKYLADRHFGKDVKTIEAPKSPGDFEKIKRVIFRDGTVTSAIDDDSLSECEKKEKQNEENICLEKSDHINHMIRIIGWGKSDKYGPYWIIANSHSPQWHNEGGTMKVGFGAAAIGTQGVNFALPKL